MDIFDPVSAPHPLAALRAGIAEYGFAAADALLPDTVFAALQAESIAQREHAKRALRTTGIRYRSHIADLGPAATAFLTGNGVGQWLRALLDGDFALSGSASCYTYYDGADFLAAHRDHVDTCSATLILYLSMMAEDEPSSAEEPGLWVYGERDPAGEPPRLIIPTRPGRMIVGCGARIWHARPPLPPGTAVSALTACFRLR